MRRRVSNHHRLPDIPEWLQAGCQDDAGSHAGKLNLSLKKENKYRPQDNPTGDTHFIVFASKIISSNFLAAILKEVPVRFTRKMLLVGIVSSRCKMWTELASFTFSKNFIGTKPMPRSCITKGIIWSAVAASTLGEKTTPFC